MTHSKEKAGRTMSGEREAAYNEWLAGEIQASLDDPRPNVTNEDALNEMDVDIESLTKL